MIRVGIVGVGLIGGSLGMALRRVKINGAKAYRVSGWGRSFKKLSAAKKRGALDEFSTDPNSALKEADIVILCVPVQKMARLAEQVVPVLKPHAVLTDVGSVKESILKVMVRLMRPREDAIFVGGHPLAGSEKAGINFARADLFSKATVVLTPTPTHREGLKRVERMWRDAGSKPLVMSAARHDELIALTSHLPHLLSFALFSLAVKRSNNAGVLKSLAAGSFRDMTRIAGSDPDIWTGIFQHNHAKLRITAAQFQRHMEHFLRLSPRRLRQELSRLSGQKMRWSK